MSEVEHVDVETTETDTVETEVEPTPQKTEKAPETPEAKRSRLKRELARLDKKHGFKDEDAEEDVDEEPKKKGDLSYGQMALLRADGIKGSDELALVKEYMGNGKQLLDIMENKHFLNDLKDLRDTKAARDAAPQNGKRAGQQSRDDVDYYLAKEPGTPGSLPTNNPELARKVIAARTAQIKNRNQFTDQSVIS
ncbi:hypothetical protein [Bradyrhizobium sp. AUGA SZCCT0431]|uniref:hypothetical protein n=1 Tax=Bradyrhizobium sp. AUGA SZCCT0431 TaxID=2807674 RepID=UPI001BA8C10A|nr:hypothetical protein [Bradyrhizobium sp. AUGA SZCCT0431]MBR1146680.1 hypothetical protein [Bradyrhizobium sp. AUGA SZCCT0431]